MARSRWRSARTLRMICVLIGCPGSLALGVPLLAPVGHLLYLRLLGAHDLLCELLFIRGLWLFSWATLAISMADWWCGVMASMNALSKGSLLASSCGSIIMPMPRVCSWLISMGTLEVPNSSFFMDLSFSISARWVETMFRESSFIFS